MTTNERIGVVIDVSDAAFKDLIGQLVDVEKKSKAAEKELKELTKQIQAAQEAQKFSGSLGGAMMGAQGRGGFAGSGAALGLGAGNQPAIAQLNALAGVEMKAKEEAEKLALAQANSAKAGEMLLQNGVGLESVISAVGTAFGAATVTILAVTAAIASVILVIGGVIALGVKFYETVLRWGIAAAETGERFHVLSQRTGMSTEFISGMSHAAKQAGIDAEQFATAIQMLNARATATPKEFEKFGIATEDANGNMLSSEQILRNVAQKMLETGSESKRAAIGMATLGRGGKELGAFLAVGSQGIDDYIAHAKQVGAITDKSEAAMGAAWHRAATDAEASYSKIFTVIGDQFVPIMTTALLALQPHIEKLLKWFQDNKTAIGDFAKTSISVLATTFQVMAMWLDIAILIPLQGMLIALDGTVNGFLRLKGVITGTTPDLWKTSAALGTMRDALYKGMVALDEAKIAVANYTEQMGPPREAMRNLNKAWHDGTEAAKKLAEQLKLTAKEYLDLGAFMNKPLGTPKISMEDAEKNLIQVSSKLNAMRETLGRAPQTFSKAENLEKFREQVKRQEEIVKQAGETFKAAADDEARVQEQKNARMTESTKKREQEEKDMDKEYVQHFDAINKDIETKSKTSLLGLLGAWRDYQKQKKEADVSNSKEMKDSTTNLYKDLTEETNKLADSMATALVGAVKSFISALSQVGQITTDTQTRIAVKSGDRIVKYVQDVSQSQLNAYKAMGMTVEQVTDTTGMHVKTVGDAIGGFFAGLASQILAELGQVIAKILIVGTLKAIFSGATGGIGGFVAGALGLNRGGPVGYASGGLVSGGTPGRDSVPAMLTPGEFVLPEHVVRSIRSGSAPARRQYADGGFVQPGNPTMGGGQRGGTAIFMMPPSRTQYARWLRDVDEPERARLRKYGVIS